MIDSIKFISEQKSATIEINQDGCKEIINEIERLNNIINQIESIVYADISNIDARITIQEVLDKELKGSDK